MAQRSFVLKRSTRFALAYGAFFLGFGAYLPFIPAWYETRGLSAEMVGLAVSASMVGRVLAAPLGAALGDRAAKKRHALLFFALATFVLFLAHIPASNPWVIVALACVAGGAYTGIIPIMDAFAMSEATRRGFAFGPPRAVGSAFFIAGNLMCGLLIQHFGGEAAVVWTIMGTGLAIVTVLLLPEGRRVRASEGPSGPSDKSGLLAAMTAGGLPLAFAASAFIQSGHGFYYAFSTIGWSAQGFSSFAIGALWATGVAAEIVFFWLSSRLFRSWSPALLMLVGGGVAALRWMLLALSPPLAVLFPLQALHAFSFGATYLGFLKYANAASPPQFATTAQAINSALSGGVMLAAATFASGFAYAVFGIGGFAVMAIPSLAGLCCAAALVYRERRAP